MRKSVSKRMMTAVLSMILVISMTVSSVMAMPVAEEGEGQVALSSLVSYSGELRLTIHRIQALAETAFTVALRSESGNDKTTSVTAPAGSAEPITVAMNDIEDGVYTLTVSAPYYLTYTQQLEFKGQCIQLDLYNDVTVNEGRTAAADGMFGVIPVGDLSGDGKINDTDADIVTNAVGGLDMTCDINGDGTVDLDDIAIVVRNSSEIETATPVNALSSSVLKEAVEVAASEGTTAEGDLSDILNQLSTDSYVTLSAASGEVISNENPVEVVMDVDKNAPAAAADAFIAEAIVIAPPSGSENYMTGGVVEVEGTDLDTGADVVVTTSINDNDAFVSAADAVNGTASKESNGAVVINLGSRVAIKKVTIRVTATANQNNLAEIAMVEFLEDFAERIPEPQLSIPTVTSVTNTPTDGLGYKDLTVEWGREPNVTGYEVSVSGNGYNKTASTTSTSYTFKGDSFNGTVLSFQTYNVRVRSVNGDWKSEWSAVYPHTVTCETKPPAPQYLAATEEVQSLKVSWNCKFDAEGFTLYYKKVGDEAYTAIGDVETDENGNKTFTLTSSSYTITNLVGGVSYTMYVVAHNRNGSSAKSNDIVATPKTPTGVEMPKYKLINTNADDGTASNHITSISGNNDKSYVIYKADGTSVANSAATADDWKALIDNNPYSYLLINDWDSGVTYSNFRGPIIQLDGRYTMDTFRMSPNEGFTEHINTAKIRYKAEDGTFNTVNTRFSMKYDSNNRKYYEIITDEPITTDYVEIRTSTSGYAWKFSICEVKLYEYDSIENDTAALFSDDMRTTLNDDVTEEQITALIERANTPDAVSGEYHPHKDMILTELNYAMQLLKEGAQAKLIKVDNQITASGNPANGFAQALSDYQPLGVVASAGDTIVIYVSGGKAAKGNPVNLKLIATQYHPEVSNWQRTVIQLKAGRNEVVIPKIGSYAKELGGSLYLQYTGAKGAYDYTVRVSGGTEIPTLNLDGVTGEERASAIQTYVTELETYTGKITGLHDTLHKNSENDNVNYDYSETECFLNSTEITLENMMYSVPAIATWNSIKSDPVNKLTRAIEAMEQAIDYYYQFKGMNKNAVDNDAYPYTRLNIRYHQMFTGAFMYAGGKHIGIEYGSVGDLFGITPIVADEKGKYISGNLSGWGIAHEIGHCINASAYQRVEVTNNMFAQLAKTGDAALSETNANFRTTYDKVYRAVATGTTGHTGDLAVQLAMYWQLHLAYDNDYAYKFYDSIEAQQNGLFYARLESYLRDRTKAKFDIPSASGGDQLFMQAACAAADKNILHFFEAWGFTPDSTTKEYAANYDIEPRKIQYIDDDSRLYRLEGGSGMSEGTEVTANITNAENSRINSNKVNISLGNTNTNENAMLGYEIYRNGKMTAFVPASQTSYTDIVATENNRTLVYTVTGVDRLLNETTTVTLPEVKVCHDGSIDKSGWTATTNMTSPKDKMVEKTEDDPESGVVNGNAKPQAEKISAITAALDNDSSTVYYGSSSGSNNRPYVILDLGGEEQVTALKFTPAAQDYSGDASEGTNVKASDLFKYRLFGYKIEVSTDGTNWTTVKDGAAYSGSPSATNPSTWNFANDIISNADGSYTMYFNKQLEDGTMDPFMYTYDAAYVKLTSTTMSAMAVAEIDILGPTSDNVELINDGFGKLAKDYNAGSYADGSECIIPAGSVVFYGSYRGDPSYNVVLLRDQNGNVLDGSQLFFAEVPEKGALGQTSDGRWIFWLENKEKTDALGDKYNEYDQLAALETVQGELYRVQDGMTLEGQRLTSTTLTMAIPDVIQDIEITDDLKNPESAIVEPASIMEAAGEHETKAPSSNVAIAAPGAYYGDTGTAEVGESSPVHFTADGNKVNIMVDPDEIAIAMSESISIDPAPDAVTVDILNTDSNLYQNYRYDNGVLTLYTVARSGNIGKVDSDDVILSYTIDGTAYGSTLTASNIYELESGYNSKERPVPESCGITLNNADLGPCINNAYIENGDTVIGYSGLENCTLIAVKYDDHGLLSDFRTEVVPADTGVNTVRIENFEADKVMAWSDLDTMAPIGEAFEVIK